MNNEKTKTKNLYRCSVSWTVVGGMDIWAESEEEARELIEERPLSTFNADYIHGSFVIDELDESEQQE